MALEVTEDGEDMEPPKKIGQSLINGVCAPAT
jgi:hypothetical protein